MTSEEINAITTQRCEGYANLLTDVVVKQTLHEMMKRLGVNSEVAAS